MIGFAGKFRKQIIHGETKGKANEVISTDMMPQYKQQTHLETNTSKDVEDEKNKTIENEGKNKEENREKDKEKENESPEQIPSDVEEH